MGRRSLAILGMLVLPSFAQAKLLDEFSGEKLIATMVDDSVCLAMIDENETTLINEHSIKKDILKRALRQQKYAAIAAKSGFISLFGYYLNPVLIATGPLYGFSVVKKQKSQRVEKLAKLLSKDFEYEVSLEEFTKIISLTETLKTTEHPCKLDMFANQLD